MNIIEMEDMVKGLPDQVLFQEAQAPSGRFPQYLAVSEIQRRNDMRQRFSARSPQEGTVKDQILNQGLGALQGMMPESVPPMAPGMAPPMAPQMAPEMGQTPPNMGPPVQMSGGGIVRMQEGRTAPYTNPYASAIIPEFIERRPIVQFGPTSAIKEVPVPAEENAGTGYEQQIRDLLMGQLNAASTGPSEYERQLLASLSEKPQTIDLSPFRQEMASLADEYRKESEQSIANIREQAKQDAFSYALMQMGAGLAAGDMAGGLERGSQAAFGVLGKAREQELAERRLGQQESRALRREMMSLGIEQKKIDAQTANEFGKYKAGVLGDLAQLAQSRGASAAQARATAINGLANFEANLSRNMADLKEQGRLNERAFVTAISNSVESAIDAMPPTMIDENQRQKFIDNYVIKSIRLFGGSLSGIDTDKAIKDYLSQGSSGSSGSAGLNSSSVAALNSKLREMGYSNVD